MVIVIESQEWERTLAKIAEIVSPKQPRFTYDYATNFSGFIQQTEQYNIFSDADSVYIVKDALCFSDATEFKAQTKFLEKWLPIWENDSQIYIFVATKLLKNKTIKQLLENIQVFTIEPITEKNKEAFLRECLKKENLVLNDTQIKLLAYRLPADASWIETEIKKLSLYPNLDKINKILYPVNETDFFQLWKLVLQQKIGSALEWWQDLISGNDLMHFVALLASQMMNSYTVRQGLDANETVSEMSQKYHFNPYFLKMEIPLLKMWKIGDLKQLITNLFQTEILVKLENVDPSIMLKYFLLKFCFKGNDA